MAERFEGEELAMDRDEAIKPKVTKRIVSMETDSTTNEAVIVLAGKSGAGKSTLFQTLLQNEMSAKSPECNSVEKNGVKITIIKNSGFIIKHQQRKCDLLVYCTPVAPGSRFQDANPAIMGRLHEMYGKDIWKHCIIVFTFSNVAWERSRKNQSEDKAIEYYKQYIEEYARAFQEELKRHAKNIRIATIFSHPDHLSNINTITAIPAGNEPKDPVLPGVVLCQYSIGWTDEIFFEMIKKCKCKERLTQFYYGQDDTVKVLTVGVANTPTDMSDRSVDRAATSKSSPVTIVRVIADDVARFSRKPRSRKYLKNEETKEQ